MVKDGKNVTTIFQINDSYLPNELENTVSKKLFYELHTEKLKRKSFLFLFGLYIISSVSGNENDTENILSNKSRALFFRTSSSNFSIDASGDGNLPFGSVIGLQRTMEIYLGKTISENEI